LQEATEPTEAELEELAKAGCSDDAQQFSSHITTHRECLQALVFYAKQGLLARLQDCITAGAQANRPIQVCRLYISTPAGWMVLIPPKLAPP
jgi:predicted outer membrane protein